MVDWCDRMGLPKKSILTKRILQQKKKYPNNVNIRIWCYDSLFYDAFWLVGSDSVSTVRWPVRRGGACLFRSTFRLTRMLCRRLPDISATVSAWSQPLLSTRQPQVSTRRCSGRSHTRHVAKEGGERGGRVWFSFKRSNTIMFYVLQQWTIYSVKC